MMSAAVIRNVIRRTSILRNEASAAAAARHFSTTGTEDSSSRSSVVDSILETPNQGATFGKLQGTIGKHTLKTDVINLLQASSPDLSLQDIRVEYNRVYDPLHMVVKFPTQSAFDSALRVIRGIPVYRLDMVAPTMWDIPYSEGKTVLLQGFPRNAIVEDIERFLCGCDYNSSTIHIFLRPGNEAGNPVKMALVQFASQAEAMSAVLKKNRSFCLNNQISMRLVQ